MTQKFLCLPWRKPYCLRLQSLDFWIINPVSSGEWLIYNVNLIPNLTRCLLLKWGYWFWGNGILKIEIGAHRPILMKLGTLDSDSDVSSLSMEAATRAPSEEVNYALARGTGNGFTWSSCFARHCWFPLELPPPQPIFASRLICRLNSQ